MFKTGDKTHFHKWYHELGYLYCLVFGHISNTGFYNGIRDSWFEHCRHCERYNQNHDLPSLSLWYKWIIFRVNVELWLKSFKKDN